jgi:murein DD-endopeptidase MepM/ murein hydrolase activator NlpD
MVRRVDGAAHAPIPATNPPQTRVPAVLAVLAVGAAAPVTALAGAPVSAQSLARSFLRPDPIPEPREQAPGDSTGFRLPFAAGQDIRIEQGWNTTFSHNGKAAYAYDFGLYMNTDVLAAAAGIVAFVHDGETKCGGPKLRDKANYVTIYHADGSATQYGHLSKVSVKVGEVVAEGEVIGKSGDTGYSQCMPHLHFARQYEGSGVTQSVPVYFDGYARKQFVSGDLVSAQGSPCAAPTADGAQTGSRVLDGFCGAYSGGAFNGPVAFVRRDALLNFDWTRTGPGGYWLDSASTAFSARWSGDFVFASAGSYTVGAMWTGAIVVSIDGVRVIDRSDDEGVPMQVVVSTPLGAGIHRIDVEYLATTGHGMLKLGWGRELDDD